MLNNSSSFMGSLLTAFCLLMGHLAALHQPAASAAFNRAYLMHYGPGRGAKSYIIAPARLRPGGGAWLLDAFC